MSDDPPRHTFAWFHTRTEAELRDILCGGPIGNGDVDSARVELGGRWNRRAFWAAAAAAIFALAGVIVALIK